jgi:hypothetical protein
MMILPPNAELIAWSDRLATYRESASGRYSTELATRDPEIAWIKEDKALLIQGHPEFGPPAFEKYSMELVDRLIWGKDVSRGTNSELTNVA